MDCGVTGGCQQDTRVRFVSVGRFVLLAPAVVLEEFAELLLFSCRFGWYDGWCKGQVAGLVF